MNAIPEDILCQIFRLTLPVWDCPESQTLSALKEPWNLSAVCSFWRSTALADKALWAVIRVDCRVMPDLETLFKQVLAKVTLCVGRSDPAPLSVYYMGYSAPGLKDGQHNFIQALWNSSARWARLHTDTLHCAAGVPVHVDLPLLEELFYQFPHYLPHRSMTSALEDAPRLKQITLRSYGHDPLTDLRLPFDRIQMLDFIMQGRHYLPTEMIYRMPALESLTYSCLSGPDGHHYAVHQQLDSLTTDSLNTFLMTCFPKLQSLTIDNPPHLRVRTTSITTILTFIHQNEFALTSLSLGRVLYDKNANLRELFHALPHLTRLQIIERHSWSESFWTRAKPLGGENNDWSIPWRMIFSALRRTESNDVLPRLQLLDLQTRQTTFLMDGLTDLLLQMLASRIDNRPWNARVICLPHHPASFHGRREVPTTLVDDLAELARAYSGSLEAEASMVLVPSSSIRRSPYYDPIGISCDSSRVKWLLKISVQAFVPSSNVEESSDAFLPPMINW